MGCYAVLKRSILSSRIIPPTGLSSAQEEALCISLFQPQKAYQAFAESLIVALPVSHMPELNTVQRTLVEIMGFDTRGLYRPSFQSSNSRLGLENVAGNDGNVFLEIRGCCV